MEKTTFFPESAKLKTGWWTRGKTTNVQKRSPFWLLGGMLPDS